MVTWKSETIIDASPCLREEFLRARGIVAGSAPVLVALQGDAWMRMQAHARSSRVEVGGALLGTAHRDERGDLLVDVVAAIPATGAREEGTYFRMTPEAWEGITAERQALDPGLLIVGWYHTHPGLGIFYSGTDRSTQRAFFTQPWNFGVVIDPQRDGIGYFLGPESVELPASRVVRYTRVQERVPAEEEALVAAGPPVEPDPEVATEPVPVIPRSLVTVKDVITAVRLVAVAAVVVVAVRRTRSRR